jgi:hypothetical protein
VADPVFTMPFAKRVPNVSQHFDVDERRVQQ